MIQEKIFVLKDPSCGVLLRFKNDLGGRDSVFFDGRYPIKYEAKTDTTREVALDDFTFSSKYTTRVIVTSKRAQEKLVLKRMFKLVNKEGVMQLLRSRKVEMFTGVKNDTLSNQRNKWIEVQIALLEWTEKSYDGLINVSIEVILPELFTDTE